MQRRPRRRCTLAQSPELPAIARAKGHAGSVGDGSNRWSAVHTLDAAHLYRLAIEGAPASSQLYGVADEGVPFREIAESIGRNLDLPAVSVSPEDVGGFDYLSWAVSLDNPTSSDEGHYFQI